MAEDQTRWHSSRPQPGVPKTLLHEPILTESKDDIVNITALSRLANLSVAYYQQDLVEMEEVLKQNGGVLTISLPQRDNTKRILLAELCSGSILVK